MAPSSDHPAPPDTTSTPLDVTDETSDPRRPDDHIDSANQDHDGGRGNVTQPRLGPAGYIRYFWRQLTSMRTALLLLMLLAVASIPGSLVPQQTADPNGVVQYKTEHPALYPIWDKLGLFNTYSSPWFSAVYLLLFISLIGCIIPRAHHHWKALRARPPKTPARLTRLAGYQSVTIPESTVEADQAVESARTQLRRAGYRTARYGDSISAERGYLRETGNLVFHIALLGVLITVGFGSGFGYTGDRVVVQGQSLSDVLSSYDSFNPGRFFTDTQLPPYNLRLDKFTVKYEEKNAAALGTPIDYTAKVTEHIPGQTPIHTTIEVNEPLTIDGAQVYLLGNGYAVNVTVRDGKGNIALQDSIPFLPQDTNLTSLGVIKVPDAQPDQLGMIGFFYPSAATLSSGALTSNFPDTVNPKLTLNVYSGNLGLNNGIPKSVYQLNTAGLTPIAGIDKKALEKPLVLTPHQTVTLPRGLGSVTFDGVTRFASFEVHRDPTQGWVLVFAILIVGGLLTGLFIPRRRLWVKATRTPTGLTLEYAGLARGEDPLLDKAVTDFATKHTATLQPSPTTDGSAT
jgi:cytochrome c biogenesis protein